MMTYLHHLSLLGALLVACSSEGETPDDFDAGADAGVAPDLGVTDSGVLDAGTMDTGGPADTGAPGSSLVKVVFEPTPGAPSRVLFHEPNGDLIESVTAVAGVAEHELPLGGMLTVVSAGGGYLSLLTVADVAPGETYHWQDPTVSAVESVNVSIQVPTPFPGASLYLVDGPCFGLFIFGPGAGENAEWCWPAGVPGDLLVRAVGPNEELLAYDLVQLAPTDGSTITLPGPWRTDLRTGEVVFQHMPPDARDPIVNVFVGSESARALEFESLTVRNGESHFGPKLFPGFGDIDLRLNLESAGAAHEIWMRTAWKDEIAIDLATQLMQPLRDPVAGWAADATRPTLRWSLDAPTSPAVALQIGQGDERRVSWQIWLPAGQTSLRIPELPIDLAPQSPTRAASIQGSVYSTPLQSFEAVRAHLQENLALGRDYRLFSDPHRAGGDRSASVAFRNQ